MRDNIVEEYVSHNMTTRKHEISAMVLRNVILINFHIFHIFSLPNLFKMLYSYDSILMCMTNLSIYTIIHLNLTVSFK